MIHIHYNYGPGVRGRTTQRRPNSNRRTLVALVGCLKETSVKMKIFKSAWKISWGKWTGSKIFVATTRQNSVMILRSELQNLTVNSCWQLLQLWFCYKISYVYRDLITWDKLSASEMSQYGSVSKKEHCLVWELENLYRPNSLVSGKISNQLSLKFSNRLHFSKNVIFLPIHCMNLNSSFETDRLYYVGNKW